MYVTQQKNHSEETACYQILLSDILEKKTLD